MNRMEHLNKYLQTLQSSNKDGKHDVLIDDVLAEINNELGIVGEKTLSSYSTVELHEELAKRTGVFEIVVGKDQEAVITTITGDIGKNKSYSGPVRILVNQD